jgi:Zn ribbon nucleic-acid-binding protein
MAVCPHCKNETNFTGEAAFIPDTITIVKCSACGTAIGAVDLGGSSRIDELNQILKAVITRLDRSGRPL